ncbi:leucine-rich repeat domain-containing protein [Ascoidea rubescens DSM 1968]|uniref:Outer arm dynein light chain 1 n=1 Tax=Ascoidea rubescens DSM 1968 TaxID=1344418 RepID=A0A1D2VFG5_9ASCO|nr:outer arm dynein light chain 1 [Ascoidea rubescens DSM 1968]ODV60414.1 outer arm dynein light chain 1 [Ascoidea rubescens DSM 1968]
MLASAKKILILVRSISFSKLHSPYPLPEVLNEFWRCMSSMKNMLLFHRQTLNEITIDFHYMMMIFNCLDRSLIYPNQVFESPRYKFDSQFLFSDKYVNYGLFDLTKLKLDGMNLNEIGSGVLKLNNLKHLQMRRNNFGSLKTTQFPDNIKHLDLILNEITSIQNVLFPKNLVTLSLTRNNIKTFRNLIGCENLLKLDLSYNSITKVSNVSQFKKLRILNLQFNSIKCIKNLSALSNLEELYLTKNSIQNIKTLK